MSIIDKLKRRKDILLLKKIYGVKTPQEYIDQEIKGLDESIEFYKGEIEKMPILGKTYYDAIKDAKENKEMLLKCKSWDDILEVNSKLNNLVR